MTKTTRTIKVDYLARVEGEGAMYLKIDQGAVTDVQLRIFEPPRFFEALLRGRRADEAPDITARICGICPVAYQMSAVHAVEQAAGVEVGGMLRELRRLIYCGEWIESHGLHIYMLHAPDFLGYPSAIEMARDHGELVKQGLRLKKAGNTLVSVVGGREIHPVNVRVGGFYRVPTRAELTAMVEELKWARDAAVETARWAATLEFPDFEVDYEFVALRHEDEYPFNEGRIVSTLGVDIDVSAFEEHFEERHVPHSNALHCVHKGFGAYFVGPMARYAINQDRLPELARQVASEVGLGAVCRNPFKSILVRAVELVFAFDEALRIIASYERPEVAHVDVSPSGRGQAATEAPRGLLYHRYDLDEAGQIVEAKIVPPTSQNQMRIEQDLRELVPAYIDLDDEALRERCELAIRNYDPCISCATHFLDLEVDRT